MAYAEFSISYHGPAVDAGRLDVATLAPSLIALDKLYREARPVVDPDAPPVKLTVKEAERGSLVIDLALVEIVADGMIDGFADLLTSRQSDAALALIEYIGAVTGLLSFMKRLRGRTPQVVAQASDSDVVVAVEGEEITVPETVLREHGNMMVRRRVREVLEPLEAEGVERIELRRETETMVSVGEQQLGYFEVEPVTLEETLEYEQDAWLRVASPSFVPGHKWRFSEGSSSATFLAAMDDREFATSVQSSEVEFRAGDDLHCRMEVRETINEAGEASISRRIVEVLEHRPGLRLPPHRQPRQPALEWSEGEPNGQSGDEDDGRMR